jgi:hypothetical protein
MLNGLLTGFTGRIDFLRGQSSLVVSAFLESVPEDAEPAPQTAVPAARPAIRVRIPARLRHRVQSQEHKEPLVPADATDPEVQGLLADLNGYHLWLCASAIDAVSAYYSSLFVTVGYLDPNLWPCSAYGELRMPEVAAKPMDWFRGKADAFIAARGMVGVADAIASALPALKGGREVKTPPATWFRGSGPVLRLIRERHGVLAGESVEGWFLGDGAESSEAARALGFVSWLRVVAGEATLWVVDVPAAAGQSATRRFDALLTMAQDCVGTASAAATEYFGCAAAPQQAERQEASRQPAPQGAAGQKGDSTVKQELPKGKDPSFVPIKLRAPTGRLRAVKVIHR